MKERLKKFVAKVGRFLFDAWLLLSYGMTNGRLVRLYGELARLEYRDWQHYELPGGVRFAISTLRGGPRINCLARGTEFLMKMNSAGELYIQERYVGEPDLWREVYRSYKTITGGYWAVILYQLSCFNPCVPNREEGFA